MTLQIENFGAGGATGWVARTPTPKPSNKAIFRGGVPATPLDADFEDINLTQLDGAADLLSDGLWNVRNQGRRGTCNAFAAVAAEELWAFHNKNRTTITPLSEEFLYAQTRVVPFADVDINLEATAAAKLKASGGTFLAQTGIAIHQTGVCAANLMEYQPDQTVAFYEKDIPQQAVDDAASRNDPPAEFDHNITKRAEVGLHKAWRHELPASRISAVFIDALKNKRPVIASFAILAREDWIWTDDAAKSFGHVRYPHPQIAAMRRPVAGHAVCLVGMQINEQGTTENPGWFLFRNSYGVDLFAKEQYRDDLPPIALAPGYGTISAYDVDRYCWEYLIRA